MSAYLLNREQDLWNAQKPSPWAARHGKDRNAQQHNLFGFKHGYYHGPKGIPSPHCPCLLPQQCPHLPMPRCPPAGVVGWALAAQPCYHPGGKPTMFPAPVSHQSHSALTVWVGENREQSYFVKWTSRPSMLEVLNELIVHWDAIMSMNFVINAGTINLFFKSPANLVCGNSLWRNMAQVKHTIYRQLGFSHKALSASRAEIERAACYGRFPLVDRDRSG